MDDEADSWLPIGFYFFYGAPLNLSVLSIAPAGICSYSLTRTYRRQELLASRLSSRSFVLLSNNEDEVFPGLAYEVRTV